MPKKRKTRQEKIILQLKRELKRQKQVRQEAISPTPKPKLKEKSVEKRADNSVFSYHPSLIKKDLARTLILTLIILSLEFVLYLKLR